MNPNSKSGRKVQIRLNPDAGLKPLVWIEPVRKGEEKGKEGARIDFAQSKFKTRQSLFECVFIRISRCHGVHKALKLSCCVGSVLCYPRHRQRKGDDIWEASIKYIYIVGVYIYSIVMRMKTMHYCEHCTCSPWVCLDFQTACMDLVKKCEEMSWSVKKPLQTVTHHT